MTSEVANMASIFFDHVSDAAEGAYQSCVTEQRRQVLENWQGGGDLSAASRDCVRPYSFEGWPLIGLVVWWIAIGLVVWWLPAWRIRRRRYEQIGRVVPASIASDGVLPDRADLFALLARIQLGTDVAVPVTYLLDPLDPRCSALAFGRPGHRCIVLSGGSETLFRRDPVAFRTVLLHELAHIHNRDLDIGFLTIVAWRVTMPLMVLSILSNPFIPVIRGTSTDSALVALSAAESVTLLALAVMAPLLRNSVLRSRELFADAQAELWGSGTTDMSATLAGYFPSSRRRRPEVLRVHPSPQRRRAVLHDSQLLRTTSGWDWCAVGAGAMILRRSILGAWPAGDVIGDQVGTAIAAVFITVALGMAAWQGTAQEGQPQLRGRRSVAVSVALGLGLAAGSSLLQPDIIGAIFLVPAPLWGQFLAWIPLLCLTAWAAQRWLGAVLASWADAVGAREGRAAKRVLWAVLGVASVPVYLGLAFLTLGLQLAMFKPIFGPGNALGGVAVLATLPAIFLLLPPLALPVLVITAVLPLAGAGAASLRQPLRKVLWYGIGAAAPTFFLLLSGARLVITVGVVALVQTVCAVHVALTEDRQQHPLAAATVAALGTGLIGNLSGLAAGTWHRVAVGATFGVIAGSASAAVALGLRRRRARRADVAQQRARKPSSAAVTGPWVGPPKVTWGRRKGVWFGVGAAAAAVLLVPFGILLAMLVVALAQVVCAVRVALTADWRPRPVAAAAYAALIAGFLGYLGLLAFAAVVLPSSATARAASEWITIAVSLAFVVGVAVGFGVAVGSASASAALGVRHRRAQQSSGLDMPPDTATAGATDQ
ncbi:M48 family metalloprotease [Streptomyces alanosinicus]|nr:M48 family metalloprotease [Streptomyces alanosinicus]